MQFKYMFTFIIKQKKTKIVLMVYWVNISNHMQAITLYHVINISYRSLIYFK